MMGLWLEEGDGRMAAPTDEGSGPMLAGELLARMGRELADLGSGLDVIQEILSPVLTPVLLSRPELVAGLQDLDRVAQTVRALSDVAHRLAEALPPGPDLSRADLLGAVTLGDLAARLAQDDER